MIKTTFFAKKTVKNFVNSKNSITFALAKQKQQSYNNEVR